MTWKQRYPRQKSQRKHEWSGSSGDDYSFRRFVSTPASSAEQALWRAAKRITSAARWLKLDLALLAEEQQFLHITRGLDEVTKALGGVLLPQLGHAPLGADSASRPEVIELVNVLCTLPKLCHSSQANHKDVYVQTGMLEGQISGTGDIRCAKESYGEDVNLKRSSQTSSSPAPSSTISKGMQAGADFFVRHTKPNLVGTWFPLDSANIRRGCILRCVKSCSTSNANGHNVRFGIDDMVKVFRLDNDGDAETSLLTDLQVKGLASCSIRYWLLQDTFKNFEIWQPSSVNLAEVAELRVSRQCDTQGDDE